MPSHKKLRNIDHPSGGFFPFDNYTQTIDISLEICSLKTDNLLVHVCHQSKQHRYLSNENMSNFTCIPMSSAKRRKIS